MIIFWEKGSFDALQFDYSCLEMGLKLSKQTQRSE